MEKSNAVGRKKMPVEVYFLRYAYPCAYLIRDRGRISDEELKTLENAALKGIVLERAMLENIFKNASHNLKLLADEMGKDKWDYEVLEEYFTKKHNEILDAGGPVRGIPYKTDTPPSQRELCKIKLGTILEKKSDILRVDLEDKVRNVFNHLVPDAKPGDKVRVHFGYAVEIVV